MNSKYIIKAGVIVVTVLLAAQSAQAENTIDPLASTSAVSVVVTAKPGIQNGGSNVALYRQLDELRSQNALLTETLKNAELKNKITNVNKTPSGQLSPSSVIAPTSPINAYAGSAVPLSAQVQMVSGSENNLTAVISLSTGGRVTARVGSNITGLGVVKSISLNEVVVASKAETIVLPFASDSSAPNAAGAPSMMSGMTPGGVR